MRLNKTLTWVVFAGLALAASSAARADGWVNGWWIYPYKTSQTTGVYTRPFTQAQAMAGISVHDITIHNLGVNAKGMNITGTEMPDGSYMAYRWIAIWHCEVTGVNRTPGGHVDFIRLAGVGSRQHWPTTIKLQDIYCHDGDGIPLFIQDCKVDKLILKDIRVERATVAVQIGAANDGSIDQITIDHAPYQSIAILGRPGSIKTIYIKNSPGLKISDVLNQWGQAGCKFVYLN